MLRDLISLYTIFFRIGAVTFGGGYAMLPILRREIVQNKGWVDEETIMDYYALSQGLPGIISINVAVFIGNKQRGFLGGIASALGMVSPCLIIITVIAAFLQNFKDNVYVKHALSGISVCVAALILDAVVGLWKKGVKDIPGIVICFAMLGLSIFTDLSPIILIVACALLGIGLKSFSGKKAENGGAAK